MDASELMEMHLALIMGQSMTDAGFEDTEENRAVWAALQAGNEAAKKAGGIPDIPADLP